MRKVTVLVVHAADTHWDGVRGQLERLVSEGLTRSFVVRVAGSGDAAEVDPRITELRLVGPAGVEWNRGTLLGHLASLGEVDQITVTCLNFLASSDPDAPRVSKELDAEMSRVRSLLVKFATTIERTDVRCAVISEGEKACGAPFFSPLADVNVLVLPRDVSMSRAVARPISRDNELLFAIHSAVEICSLLGLWECMDGSPLVGIKARQLGQRGYELRLFSSRVKGLLTPPLPIADLIDDSGELPMPNGFTSVDNLRIIVERYAAAVYPKNLVFSPLPRDEESLRLPWRKLAAAYITEFGRMLMSIPSMIRNGFKGELDVMGSHALDRLLGGVEARIRPMIPAEEGSEGAIVTADGIEEIIRDIEFREDRPIMEALSPEQWEGLISGVLGVADANPSVDSLRHSVMPSGFLVRDKVYLAPDPESVTEHVRAVMPPAPAIVEAPIEDPGATASPGGADLDADEDDLQDESTSFVPVTFVAPGEVDLTALREAVRRSGMSRPEPASVEEGTAAGQSDIQVGGAAIRVDRAESTLVGLVTSRFDDEFRKSEDSVLECLTELRAIPSKFESSSADSVSRSVFVAIAVALGVIIVSLATHDPLRSLLSFDWTSGRNRDFVWVVLSTLVAVLAIATMPSSTRKNWQSRAVTAAAICAGILAFEYVSFDPIRDRVVGFSWGATTALAAFLILGATVLVSTVSIRRNSSSPDPIRQRLSRVLVLVLWAYLVVGASSFVAGPESFLVDWDDSTRRRLLVATQFVGWICLLMATFVIVMVRVRQRNAYGTAQIVFAWAQDNLVHSIDQRRLLRAAYTQWLMVSAVISRILWHPLGRETTEQVPFAGTLSGDESVLKFDLAGVELSADGHVALLAKLKQMFVRPGWLQTQFDCATDAYQEKVAFSTGDPIEQHNPVTCPSVPSVDEILEGGARGDRFAFAQNLLSGSFDHQLLSAATRGNLDAVYASILTDARMHDVMSSQHQFDSGADFLADICPEDRTKIPPRMLAARYVPGDPMLLMDVSLWWPQTELLDSPKYEHITSQPSRILRLERLDDSVIMVSVLTELSQAFLNSDVVDVQDLDQPLPSAG